MPVRQTSGIWKEKDLLRILAGSNDRLIISGVVGANGVIVDLGVSLVGVRPRPWSAKIEELELYI